jgi:hypothetical protein
VARGIGSEERIYRLESELEQACCRVAKAAGWFCRKYKGPGRRSHPDQLFARRGAIFFIEFKLPGNEPTELQWLEIKAMRAAGLTVEWFDNIGAFRAFLSKYD